VNLLYVTHAYPRSEGDVAGAFVERLALALRQRNHALHVIAPADRGRGGEELLHGIPVSRVRYASPKRETLAYTGAMVEGARSPAGAWAALNLVRAQAAEIAHRCSAMPADVVHAHWWVPGGVSAWWCRGLTKPYVVTVHGTDVRLLAKSPLVRAVARRVFRGAAAITAVSSYLAERVAAVAGIDVGDIVVQPMPVEVARFDRISQGGGGIVSVGRLTKQKNLGIVFRALDHLRRSGLYVPLRLIGDGPERQLLETEAVRMELQEHVEFVGAVEPDRLPDAVGDADVSVFAATQEGFGLAAAESLMLGIPVVALESGGGVRDVVPETGAGRIVADDDPVAMADAISDLLRDDSGRRLAAEQGRRLKREFRPDAVAATFESVYENV
jgi:glycosyltransferase involved in cell wall biosynthesis